MTTYTIFDVSALDPAILAGINASLEANPNSNLHDFIAECIAFTLATRGNKEALKVYLALALKPGTIKQK